MFERYTEKARRVIFFARYEASQFGSPYIETEHLLLGLLREDKQLTNRFLRSQISVVTIRKQIEGRTQVREHISTSVDLPLSQECKRVLAYAAEEAERLSHKHIGTEHLLLGIMREDKSFAAQILDERGLRLFALREELARLQSEKVPSNRAKETSLLSEFSRDLTQAAMEKQLDPLIGRQNELERVVQILCRRTRNNVVLIGQAGVGKKAVVHGLAQRIADGGVPSLLADKRILALEASSLAGMTSQGAQLWRSLAETAIKLTEAKTRRSLEAVTTGLTEAENTIIFVEDLYILAGALAASFLRPALSHGTIQCIASATPEEYRKAIENEPWIERYFLAINVPPASEAEAHTILAAIKGGYETFHGVTYTDEALKYAVNHSKRYIPNRHLPAIAIDLMDEAGVSVMLREGSLPEEVNELRKRIRFIVQRMENAIQNHEFEKAKFYTEEERKERENLRALSEIYNLDQKAASTVTVDDIEDVVARWTGVPVTTIRQDRASAEG
ncbi:MAG: hypothetical protein DMG22_18125 [Acidobacteria bacterium]|nr:MAG: hypothetical protein DMG22_18125 [Acidobacteriota bacterium]